MNYPWLNKLFLVVAVILLVIAALISGTVFTSSISAQTFGLWGIAFGFAASLL
jgi:hypothetical protein